MQAHAEAARSLPPVPRDTQTPYIIDKIDYKPHTEGAKGDTAWYLLGRDSTPECTIRHAVTTAQVHAKYSNQP